MMQHPILTRFKELYYGMQVWQNPELLNKSVDEYNKLENSIDESLNIRERLWEWKEQLENETSSLAPFFINQCEYLLTGERKA